MLQRTLCTAAFAALSLSTFAAQAAADSPTGATTRVELTGQRDAAPRRDVIAVCPALHQQLPEALASAFSRVGKPGVVQVEFTLYGQRIMEPVASSGPARYHRDVRNALQDLSCSAGQATPQRYVLNIRFIDPIEQPGGQTVALLAMESADTGE